VPCLPRRTSRSVDVLLGSARDTDQSSFEILHLNSIKTTRYLINTVFYQIETTITIQTASRALRSPPYSYTHLLGCRIAPSMGDVEVSTEVRTTCSHNPLKSVPYARYAPLSDPNSPLATRHSPHAAHIRSMRRSSRTSSRRWRRVACPQTQPSARWSSRSTLRASARVVC